MTLGENTCNLFEMGYFAVCKVSTDKRVVQSLSNSRASCSVGLNLVFVDTGFSQAFYTTLSGMVWVHASDHHVTTFEGGGGGAHFIASVPGTKNPSYATGNTSLEDYFVTFFDHHILCIFDLPVRN